MSTRLSRKEIKRDGFAESVGGFFGFVSENARAIALGIVAIVVLALALAGYRAYSEGRAAKGSRALAKALEVYNAPIDAGAADPENTDTPVFADEASRLARARVLFAEVADDFARTDAGDVAIAYLGSIAAAEGDLEGARERWQRFLGRQRNHILAMEIRLNMMVLDSALGRGEELVDELRAELSASRSDLPEEVLLNQLGRTLESLGRSDEAADIYRRLVQDYPLSTYSRQANERLQELEAAANEAA